MRHASKVLPLSGHFRSWVPLAACCQCATGGEEDTRGRAACGALWNAFAGLCRPLQHALRCTLLTLAVAQPTLGHPISIVRGSAVVSSDVITVTINVHGEDLLHTQRAHSDVEGSSARTDVQRAVEAYGHMLLRRIVLRDARGNRIDGRCVGPVLDHQIDNGILAGKHREVMTSYEFLYESDGKNDYVSFQQDATVFNSGLFSNIVLAVYAENELRRTIQLTRGGNVEVVRLVQARSDGHSIDGSMRVRNRVTAFVLSEAQRTIRSIVTVHGTNVTVDVFLPIPLLETWMPIIRQHRDFLTMEEQGRAPENIERFLNEYNPVSFNGSPIVGDVIGIEFLDVGEIDYNESMAPRRLSAWTSRVRIRKQYSMTNRLDSLSLDWTLFNASVLTASVLLVDEDRCAEYELSTYAPTLTWSRADQPSALTDNPR